MFILFVLKINRLWTVGNETENFFCIDNDDYLFCLMALAPPSKVKPNGVFRWVSFFVTLGNSYMGFIFGNFR